MAPRLVEVVPGELARQLDAGDVPVLVDVRTAEERAIAAIEPSLHIGLHEFAQRAPQELPREADVVVYCHSGQRSALASMWLAANGWQRARSLAGGIDAWSLEVDPAVPRY